MVSVQGLMYKLTTFTVDFPVYVGHLYPAWGFNFTDVPLLGRKLSITDDCCTSMFKKFVSQILSRVVASRPHICQSSRLPTTIDDSLFWSLVSLGIWSCIWGKSSPDLISFTFSFKAYGSVGVRRYHRETMAPTGTVRKLLRDRKKWSHLFFFNARCFIDDQ